MSISLLSSKFFLRQFHKCSQFIFHNPKVLIPNHLQSNIVLKTISLRQFSLSRINFEEEGEKESNDLPIDPAKDRRNPIPVETSIRYVASEAYKKCYGDEPVWKYYRRNHKGRYAPRRTRKTCIRKGVIETGNPCPICRDEYLVIHPYNVKLLEQFISPFNGETLSYSKTGICQKQHRNLLIAITQAKNKGLITFDVPFREYNYEDYKASVA